jgi:hypothetical protein
VALLLVAACSFEHGVPVVGDAHDEGSDSIERDAALQSDAPIDARVCPDKPGCTVFQCASSSSCYYNCTATKRPWQAAQDDCKTIPGACLVTINDQEEEDCIVANAMPTFPTFPWIGYHQGPTAAEPAGGWSFVCGTSTFSPAWAPGEPDEAQGGAEDCTGMAEDGWFDNGCAEVARYLCELP